MYPAKFASLYGICVASSLTITCWPFSCVCVCVSGWTRMTIIDLWFNTRSLRGLVQCSTINFMNRSLYPANPTHTHLSLCLSLVSGRRSILCPVPIGPIAAIGYNVVLFYCQYYVSFVSVYLSIGLWRPFEGMHCIYIVVNGTDSDHAMKYGNWLSDHTNVHFHFKGTFVAAICAPQTCQWHLSLAQWPVRALTLTHTFECCVFFLRWVPISQCLLCVLMFYYTFGVLSVRCTHSVRAIFCLIVSAQG